MSKKSHLDPGRVIALSSDAVHSKKRLFEFAATALRDAFKLDAETVYKALLSREKLGSTAFGGGIAIPHCRIPECTDAAGCLITLGEGIDFNAPDSLPVDVARVVARGVIAVILEIKRRAYTSTLKFPSLAPPYPGAQG